MRSPRRGEEQALNQLAKFMKLHARARTTPERADVISQACEAMRGQGYSDVEVAALVAGDY